MKIDFEIIEPKKERLLKSPTLIIFKIRCLNFLQIKMAFMEYWRNNTNFSRYMVSGSIRCKNQ